MSNNNDLNEVLKKGGYSIVNEPTEIEKRLKELEKTDPSVYRETFPTLPNKSGKVGVSRVSARANSINWSEIRRTFVIGKKKQLEDGTWITEDYSYKELAEKFGVKRTTVQQKGAQESWMKLRKAFLARVMNQNLSMDMGLYVTENYQAEVSAMNACNKLGVVLDKYIESKFGHILEKNEDINNEDEKSLVMETIVTKNGEVIEVEKEIDISEIKDAIKVAQDIYGLQRKIYDNAPKPEVELIEKMTNKPKFRSERERQQKIAQLEQRLGRKLKVVGDD